MNIGVYGLAEAITLPLPSLLTLLKSRPFAPAVFCCFCHQR